MTPRRAPALLAIVLLTAASVAAQEDAPRVQPGYPPADLRTDKDVIRHGPGEPLLDRVSAGEGGGRVPPPRSDRVVFLLDADFTGNTTGRSYSRQTTRSGSAAFLERLASATGRVFITASGANESALEAADVRHGLFTYYLLQGLGGGADRDGDGIVTLNELYGFVQGKVAEHARKLGTRQTPFMQGALTDLPLVEVPKR